MINFINRINSNKNKIMVIGDIIVKKENFITTTKIRYVTELWQHLLRIDNEMKLKLNRFEENNLIEKIKHCIDDYNVIVISDYDKGFVSRT